MPELPEVETVRRSLLPYILDKEIIRTEIFYPRVLPKNEVDEFVLRMQHELITNIKRRGKYLIMPLSSQDYLIVHLRMTGRLLYKPQPPLEMAKHTSARFVFADQSELHFVDQRKFGTIYLMAEEELDQISGLANLGPEPLGNKFTKARLTEIVDRSIKIKAILLDQKRIAGLGNIYVDEALFLAGIHPNRFGNTLKEREIASLHRAIRRVLRAGIEHQGTTIRDYQTGSGSSGQFQNMLNVYGKANQPCPRCARPIEKTRVAGRGTHFCPHCQEEDK